MACYVKRLWGHVRANANFQCPRCGEAVPVNAKVCPNPGCGQPITLDAAMAAPRQRWQRFLANADTETMRRVQWGYLILSAAVLWSLLAFVEQRYSEHWIRHALLSVVYLAVFGFLAPLIVPRHVFRVIATRTGWRVRLGLVLNYLALLLLLQILIGTWWARALMLAGFFGVTCVAVWVLRAVLLPTFMNQSQPQDTRFDPTAPQGRRGRFD